MPVESAADLAAFFDTDEFGTAATWTVGATPSTVNGIFRDPHISVAGLDDLGVSSTDPEFVCAAADVPAGGGQGDQIVIDGTSYLVVDPRPSGDGLMRVILKEA